MLRRIRAHWVEFSHWPAGERFTRFYETQRGVRSRWSGPLIWLLALLALAVGVVLVFIPGPAILFFAITAALLASQSRWLAARLDVAEVRLRDFWDAQRRRHAHRSDGGQP